MYQQHKLIFATLATHAGFLTILHLIQLCYDVPWKSIRNDPCSWVASTHKGDLDEDPDSWLWPSPALTFDVIWVNQWVNHNSFFL